VKIEEAAEQFGFVKQFLGRRGSMVLAHHRRVDDLEPIGDLIRQALTDLDRAPVVG
jgi:hypothetical protein